jgi:hypothetical protein
MAKAKVMTGARAKVLINNQEVGLFTNCTWSMTQGKVPLFILGRFSPVEITPVDQDAVRLSLSGFRVIGSGPYAVANATQLKNLLNEEDFAVAIVDRQSGERIFTAVGCRVLGWSSGVSSRGVSDVRLDIMGLKGEDETSSKNGGDDEPGAASF